jgi:hypothetical protein
VSETLFEEARRALTPVISEVITGWKGLGRKHPSERICCLLSFDDKVHQVAKLLSDKYSVHIRGLFQRFLDSEEFLSKLIEKIRLNISTNFDEFNNIFIDVISRQVVFVLALSPVVYWERLRAKIYDVVEGLPLTFYDLAEAVMTQFVFLRSAAAHVYLYGSSQFRSEAMSLREKMLEKGEDFEELHEKRITKHIAPALYAFLSALNLVSHAADEVFAQYPTLKKLSISGGFTSKPIVLTGMGATLAKALLHGVATRSSMYVVNFYLSSLLGNALLVEMWNYVKTTSEVRSVVMEALARYKRIRAQIMESVKTAPKLYLRDAETYYDSADAIRDAILIYLIQNTEKKIDEVELNNLLRILI